MKSRKQFIKAQIRGIVRHIRQRIPSKPGEVPELVAELDYWFEQLRGMP